VLAIDVGNYQNFPISTTSLVCIIETEESMNYKSAQIIKPPEIVIVLGKPTKVKSIISIAMRF
jgi:hypothetical protein